MDRSAGVRDRATLRHAPPCSGGNYTWEQEARRQVRAPRVARQGRRGAIQRPKLAAAPVGSRGVSGVSALPRRPWGCASSRPSGSSRRIGRSSSKARPRRQQTSNMSGGQKRNMMTAKYDMKRLQGIMKIDDKMKAKLCELHGVDDEDDLPAAIQNLDFDPNAKDAPWSVAERSAAPEAILRTGARATSSEARVSRSVERKRRVAQQRARSGLRRGRELRPGRRGPLAGSTASSRRPCPRSTRRSSGPSPSRRSRSSTPCSTRAERGRGAARAEIRVVNSDCRRRRRSDD